MTTTSNAFIIQPHQLDPHGDNYDYLNPQYKFFSTTKNIAQKQTPVKHHFTNDFDQVKYNYAYKKSMTQDNTYPTKVNYYFNKKNRDQYVGAGQEDENLHARQMRLLRIQAQNFENKEDNQLQDLSDTVPFTDGRASFIQILQNLAEIKSTTQGDSLSAIKPERLNDILSKTMNNGISFNKKQLNQLRQVLESIFNKSSSQRVGVSGNKTKFLTIMKIYAIVIQLLSTLNTQDEAIRKRKLDAFVDDVLDKSASAIADDILSNFPSIIKLSSTKLTNDAKLIDTEGSKKEATSASVPKTPKPKKKPIKAETPDEKAQFRKLIKEGDTDTWNETPASDILKIPKAKVTKRNLFSLAVQNNLIEDTKTNFNKTTMEQLVILLKEKFADESDDDDDHDIDDDDDEQRPDNAINRAFQASPFVDDSDEDDDGDDDEDDDVGGGLLKRLIKARKKTKQKLAQDRQKGFPSDKKSKKDFAKMDKILDKPQKIGSGFYPQRRSLLRLLQ